MSWTIRLIVHRIKSARGSRLRTGNSSSIVPSTPAAPAPGGTNGFTFGQSQSFPPISATPGSGAQNGSQSFAFGSGGGGASNTSNSFQIPSTPSFNFTSFGSNQGMTNPFSTGAPPTANQGFQGSLFNIPPAGGQDNTQQSNQPAQSNGNLFGAATPQKTETPFSFGITTSTATAPSNVFGQTSGNNMFGKPDSTPGIFGAPQGSKTGDDAMETSPDGKPMFGGFGGTGQPSTQVSNTAQSPSFSFGASTTPATSTTQATGSTPFTLTSTAPAGGLFGSNIESLQSPKFVPPASGFSFGQASKPQENTPTTSATAQTTTPATGFSFGQVSKPTENTSTTSAIAPATTTSSPSIFSTPSATSNLFGAPAKLKDTEAPATTTTSAPSFFSTPSATNNLFGTPAKPKETETPAATAATSAPSFFSTPSTTNNLFGTSAKPKDTEAPATATTTNAPFFSSTPTATSTLFGAPDKQKQQEIQAPSTTPGTSIFAGATPSATTNNLFGARVSGDATATPSTANPLFGATKPKGSDIATSTTNPLFGATKPGDSGAAKADESKTSESETGPTSTPLFSSSVSATPFNASTATSNASTGASTSIFKPTASAPAGSIPPPTASNTLFGVKPEEPKSTNEAPKEKDSAFKPEQKPLFGLSKPQESSTPSLFTPFEAPTAEGKESSTPSGKTGKAPLFTPFKAPDAANKDDSTETSTAPSQNVFAKPATPSQDLFAKPTIPATSTSTFGKAIEAPKPKYADSGTQTKFEAQPKWASFLPESIPDHLTTEEQRENYIRMWRLGTLNASFKAQIAQIDPQKQDIDNIIAYYVMMRTQLGIPTGLTTILSPIRSDSPEDFPPKPISPLKRKADTQGDTATQKRRRSIDESDNAISHESPKNSQIFGATSTSPKRKSLDTDNDEDMLNGQVGKRAKTNGVTNSHADEDTAKSTSKPAVSDTLTKFASSFVAQKSQSTRASSPSNSEGSDGESDKEEEKTKTNGSTSPANGASPTTGGRSLFDRVQFDDAGKPMRQVEPEKEGEKEDKQTTKDDNPVASLFSGSKFASSFNTSPSTTPQFSFAGSEAATPHTPSPAKSESEKPAPSASLFGNLTPPSAPTSFTSTTPAAPPPNKSFFDTPAKDGATPSGSSAPSPSIFAKLTPKEPATFGNVASTSSAASPPSNTSTLFGTGSDQPKPLFPGPMASSPSAQPNNASPPSNTGSLFGTGSEQPQPLFPGPMASASPSQPSSTASSTDASRSTTPVQPDATAEETETDNLPQVDLSRGAGEENEDVLFETRARGLKLVAGTGWESQGVGFLRILKNRETGRSRILLRADPSGKVILNTLLLPQVEYSHRGSNVQFLVFNEAKPEQWTLKVKTQTLAADLVAIMQGNKKGE